MKTHRSLKHPSLALLLAAACAVAPTALRADPDTDHKIESTASNSYNFHTVLNDKVKPSASDGVVTLTGTVQDSSQKSLAEDTVNSIPGVVSVNDQIKTKAEMPEHSDGWIAFKINTVLLTRSHVSATNTKVTVQDGVVTLTGNADTQAQKELTEQYAKEIDGVKSVKNNLMVATPASTSNESSVAMDDSSITAQVKYQLLAHRATSAVNTKVTTSAGVVLVRGEATSATERDLVTQIATNVRGVKSVTNEMTIKGS